MTDLDELETLAHRATPGPWEWEEPSDDSYPVGDESLVTTWNEEDGYPKSVVTSWGYDADGVMASAEDRAFIAAAYPQAVLELIERVRQQEMLIVRQQRYIEELERVDGVGLTAERDAAEARIAEAAKLHYRDTPSVGGDWCPEDHHKWPCPTAVSLGLNEGENE